MLADAGGLRLIQDRRPLGVAHAAVGIGRGDRQPHDPQRLRRHGAGSAQPTFGNGRHAANLRTQRNPLNPWNPPDPEFCCIVSKIPHATPAAVSSVVGFVQNDPRPPPVR